MKYTVTVHVLVTETRVLQVEAENEQLAQETAHANAYNTVRAGDVKQCRVVKTASGWQESLF